MHTWGKPNPWHSITKAVIQVTVKDRLTAILLGLTDEQVNQDRVPMGHIRAYYERIVKLQESEWGFIAAHFVRKVFCKNELLTKQGETEDFLSFVETGILRFYIPDDETELTFNFCFEKEFTCAYDSFLTRTPSEYALQALTETVVWQISYDDLQKIYAQTTVGNYLGRFASEKLLLAKSKRELSLLKYNAKERYLKLFNEQPDILKFIPLKYIASYIGITPQGLSRIRRQIATQAQTP